MISAARGALLSALREDDEGEGDEDEEESAWARYDDDDDDAYDYDDEQETAEARATQEPLVRCLCYPAFPFKAPLLLTNVRTTTKRKGPWLQRLGHARKLVSAGCLVGAVPAARLTKGPSRPAMTRPVVRPRVVPGVHKGDYDVSLCRPLQSLMFAPWRISANKSAMEGRLAFGNSKLRVAGRGAHWL